jgi:hypothetical protein
MRIETVVGKFPTHNGAAEMVAAAQRDFLHMVPDSVRAAVRVYRAVHMPRALAAENDYIAKTIGADPMDVLLANLVYELSSGIGCTSGSFRGVHVRNLDWGFPDNLLRKHTQVLQYDDGVSIVGWPGMYGAFTGMRAGAFSISINFLIDSADTFQAKLLRVAQGAEPAAWALRRMLFTKEYSYDDVVRELEKVQLVSPCAYTITGVQPDDGVVIRKLANGRPYAYPRPEFHLVTNDYEDRRWCARHDRASSEIRAFAVDNDRAPTVEEAFGFISPSPVCNAITAHQVVMIPATGELSVRVPEV